MENKGERSKSRVSPLVSVHPPELEIQQRRYSNRAQHVVRVKTQGECGVLLNHSIKVGIAFEKKKRMITVCNILPKLAYIVAFSVGHARTFR